MQHWRSLDKKSCSDSAFAALLILLILFLVTQQASFIKVAALLTVLAMINAGIFKPFAFVWLGLSKVLGLFVPKIVLSLVFIVFVVPVGLFRKAMGLDDMKQKEWKRNSASVFKTRNHTFVKEDLQSPF